MSKTGTRPARGIMLIPVGLIFTIAGITFLKQNKTAQYLCLAGGTLILIIALGMLVSQALQRKAGE